MWYIICNFFNIIKQGTPKFQYLSTKHLKHRVKHGGDIVQLFNAFYCVELGCYLYWANANGVKVLIPENMLERVVE